MTVEKIIQLIANPSRGVARDTSVKAGATVYVKVNGTTVPAIAVNDITTAEVFVAFSEEENTYYATSGSNPQKIAEEISELVRSREKKEVVAIAFLVFVFDDLRYSDKKTTLPFTYLNGGTDLIAILNFEVSRLLSTKTHHIFLLGTTTGFVDPILRLNIWKSGGFTATDITDEFIRLIRFNNGVGTAHLPHYRQYVSSETALWLVRSQENPVASDPYKGAIQFSGTDATTRRTNAVTYTGTPELTYMFTGFPDLTVTSMTIGRVGAGQGTFAGLVYFTLGSGASAAREPEYSYEGSITERNWMISMTFIASLAQPGGGTFYTSSIDSPDWDARYDSIYTYNDPVAGFTFDYSEIVEYDTTRTLNVNITDPDPGETAATWDLSIEANHRFEVIEDIVATIQAVEIGLDPAMITKKTGSYQNRQRLCQTLNQFRITDVQENVATSLVDHTRQFIFNHTFECERRYVKTFASTFTLGSYTYPIRHNVSSIQVNLNRVAATIDVTGTEDAGGSMESSTASQVFFPGGSTEDIIRTLGTFWHRESHWEISGTGQGWLGLPIETTVLTTNGMVDLSSLDIISINGQSALISTIEVSYDYVMTSTNIYRLGTLGGSPDVNCVEYDIDNGVTGLNFVNNNPEDHADPLFLGYFAEFLSTLIADAQDRNVVTGEIESVCWDDAKVTSNTLRTNSHWRRFNTSLEETKVVLTNIDFTHSLILHNEGGLGTVDLTSAEDTLYAYATGVTTGAGVITLDAAFVYDNMGLMGTDTGMTTGLTQITSETPVDPIMQTFTTSTITTNDSTRPRKAIASYIGDDFYVFDRDSKTLHEATLTGVTALGTDGINRRTFDLDFTINSSTVMQAGTFFLPEQSTGYVAVTKDNLAAMFQWGRKSGFGFQGTYQFAQQLAIAGTTLYLTYRETDDAEPANLKIGYVHQFAVEGGKLVFKQEVAAKVFDDNIDKDAGRYKQYNP